MESIIARALEYTLKYWLKSFSRDQFKLQGRIAQLSNLDINGDALHASLGLPPTLHVTTARVGKLEITLPAVSCIQTDPIVIQIDRLDLILEEKLVEDNDSSSSSVHPSTSSVKGSGYGFADKIADGMTLEVQTVNLMLETKGGGRHQGGSAWSSPLASITIRNLWLYTTNENWEVVNLKEARDFSSCKKFIYVFKKLEWNSLSIDLLPHPDMFMDSCLSSSNGKVGRDSDGAKRVFFGGERFLDGISGQAYITVQRTEQNSPLALEVKLHVTEAVCLALSEPGLRAFLRFMTGLYVCLNRGDVDPKEQKSSEAAGCSLVSVIVDHIFLCIKDADFQLELLMQSLFFSRASISDGEITKKLTKVMVGGLFLRDTFTSPPCTLVQPSMQAVKEEPLQIPEFGKKFSPLIYPFEDKQMIFNVGMPLFSLYSLQIFPSPAPPTFASQTVIYCQPLMVMLQEQSCLRISSFLADGIVVSPGTILPDFSVNALQFNLREFDLTIPLDFQKHADLSLDREGHSPSHFSGAKLHVADLIFLQSPSIKCKLLNLEKDPACFSLWENQPIDASQKKWTTEASHLSLSLETGSSIVTKQTGSSNLSSGLWKCIEVHEACFEAAMVTSDGSPLLVVPPPGGVVRLGVSCHGYSSNTSVEQLLYVLDIYTYFGEVSERIRNVNKNRNEKIGLGKKLVEKLPSDTAVSLALNSLRLKFLDTHSINVLGGPLVQFNGEDFFLKVSHRTLGGAFAVSTSLLWETVCINCVDDDADGGALQRKNSVTSEESYSRVGNGYPQMRAVFWIDNRSRSQTHTAPFLEVDATHVMPYNIQDMECHSLNVSAKVSGVRLGGGMNYTEALLHRFGIFGPDGGPGEGLTTGLKNLSSGPLGKIFRQSTLMEASKANDGFSDDEDSILHLELGIPEDIDVSIEFNNWLFALEGTKEMRERLWEYNVEDFNREEMCWHTTFSTLKMKAKSNHTNRTLKPLTMHMVGNRPLDLVMIGIDGLQALKPRFRSKVSEPGSQSIEVYNNLRSFETVLNDGGVNIEAHLVLFEQENTDEAKWDVENIKFSIKQPIVAVVTKEELEHLSALCRSEVDSICRIAAGVLRLLNLEESIGQASIYQLSLGSESLDKIFTPNRLSRRSSIGSVGFTPTLNGADRSPTTDNMNSTVALLETEVQESQEKCTALVSALSASDCSQHVGDVKLLQQKLEAMQTILTRIRSLH